MKKIHPSWSWTKRLALLFAAAAVCEFALRMGGVVLSAPSNRFNAVRPEDSKKIRILALGESTTADYFSRDISAWPRQLESRLLREGIDARVYNEGLPSTTSAMILSRVPEYLEKYRPQIVVAMMGINDADLNLRYDASPSSRLRLAISRIRLVKLARWLASSADARLRCRIESEPARDPNFSEADREGKRLSRSLPFAEVERRLRGRISSDKDLALIYTDIVELFTVEGGLRFTPDGNVRAYADRAFDLSPYDHRVDLWELVTLARSAAKDGRCEQVGRKILACGGNVPDDLLSLIAGCGAGLASDPAFRSRGLSFQSSRNEPSPQKFHYRALHRLLQGEGVSLVAMQYPTLPVGDLESYFKGPDGRLEDSFRDIVFVANESNFSRALKSRPYSDLFVDRFRGSWGHATDLGHGLIADSAFEAVSALIKTRLKPEMARPEGEASQ